MNEVKAQRLAAAADGARVVVPKAAAEPMSGVSLAAVAPPGSGGGATSSSRNDWVFINYTYRRFPLEESAGGGASNPAHRTSISPCLFQQQNTFWAPAPLSAPPPTFRQVQPHVFEKFCSSAWCHVEFHAECSFIVRFTLKTHKTKIQAKTTQKL